MYWYLIPIVLIVRSKIKNLFELCYTISAKCRVHTKQIAFSSIWKVQYPLESIVYLNGTHCNYVKTNNTDLLSSIFHVDL